MTWKLRVTTWNRNQKLLEHNKVYQWYVHSAGREEKVRKGIPEYTVTTGKFDGKTGRERQNT